MKKIAEEWLKSAISDMAVICRIYDDPELTHMTAFHAQQSIEKSFKALWEERGFNILKIHNLVTLFDKIRDNISIPIDIQTLKTLDQLYIDSRYPGSIGLLPNGKPTPEEIDIFITLAKSVYNDIKAILESGIRH